MAMKTKQSKVAYDYDGDDSYFHYDGDYYDVDYSDVDYYDVD